MKIAPLQPQGIVFEEISIKTQLDDKNIPISSQNFDFQGVNFGCDIGHADIIPDEIEPGNDRILVAVTLSVSNETGKAAPYKISVKATGIFKWIVPSTPDVERRDLTVVNGASILYGAIREMVLTITSRSVSGALILPSFNFIDNKPSEFKQADAATIPDNPPVVVRKKRLAPQAGAQKK
jgi:hypothetical protein